MVDSFTKFLLEATGTTGKALCYLIDDSRECADAFFKPYKDPADFAIRTATVVSAPIAFAMIAVEAFAVGIYKAFEALVEVYAGDTESASKTIKLSLACFIVIALSVISILPSFFINLVDLIGGGVTSIMEQCEEESMEQCEYKPYHPGF